MSMITMTEDNISKELKKQIGQLLEKAIEDFRNLESNKKERLLKLAKDIENTGYPKDAICALIAKAISGEGISRDTIERTLPDQYKKKKDPHLRSIADKKVLEVTNDGSVARGNRANSPEPELNRERKPSPIEALYLAKTDAEGKDPDEKSTHDIHPPESIQRWMDLARDKDLEIGKLKEQFKEQSEYFHTTLKAINDNKDKSILESKEYKALQSEMFLLQEEITQLKQIETERMRKNPTETFQSATAMAMATTAATTEKASGWQVASNDITTIMTTIPNEIEFPAKDLSTFFLDQRQAKQVMYLKIEGNQVVGWESDTKRSGRK
jgi:hypothetical protein